MPILPRLFHSPSLPNLWLPMKQPLTPPLTPSTSLNSDSDITTPALTDPNHPSTSRFLIAKNVPPDAPADLLKRLLATRLHFPPPPTATTDDDDLVRAADALVKGLYVSLQRSHSTVILAFYDIRDANRANRALDPSTNIAIDFISPTELVKLIGKSAFLAETDPSLFITAAASLTAPPAIPSSSSASDPHAHTHRRRYIPPSSLRRLLEAFGALRAFGLCPNGHTELDLPPEGELDLDAQGAPPDSDSPSHSFTKDDDASRVTHHAQVFRAEFFDLREAREAYLQLHGHVMFGIELKLFGPIAVAAGAADGRDSRDGEQEEDKSECEHPSEESRNNDSDDVSSALPSSPAPTAPYSSPPSSPPAPAHIATTSYSNELEKPTFQFPFYSHSSPAPAPASAPASVTEYATAYPHPYSHLHHLHPYARDPFSYAPSPVPVPVALPGTPYYSAYPHTYGPIPTPVPVPVPGPASAPATLTRYDPSAAGGAVQPVQPGQVHWGFERAMAAAAAEYEYYYGASGGYYAHGQHEHRNESESAHDLRHGQGMGYFSACAPYDEYAHSHAHGHSPYSRGYPGVGAMSPAGGHALGEQPSVGPSTHTHDLRVSPSLAFPPSPSHPHGGSGGGGGGNALNLARIEEGADTRTTVMIKNIPNKMSDRDLIAYIAAVVPRRIDFLYLRVDFSNGCNVGYAFVNFMSVEDLLAFAKARLGVKWNMFSSEKVLQMSYANYQGKEALVEKFKNSPIMDERESWRPKMFFSDPGPRQGLPEPFPAPTHLRRKERGASNRGALFTPGVGPTGGGGGGSGGGAGSERQERGGHRDANGYHHHHSHQQQRHSQHTMTRRNDVAATTAAIQMRM